MEDHPTSCQFVSSEYDAIAEQEFAIPFGGLLDNFVRHSQSADGVDLQSLARHDLIRLQTKNSQYRIILLDPKTGRASVQGGTFFSDATEAVVCGSTLGGAILKIGWIGIGLQLELIYQPLSGEAQSIVTSPVTGVRLERAQH